MSNMCVFLVRPKKENEMHIRYWSSDVCSSDLDLGCGDGTLLAYLQNNKSVVGAGVDLNDEHVIASVRRGVQVIQQNLEEGLALFDDQQFDTVVLSQTLQSMHHTEHIFRDMARDRKSAW